MISAKHLITVSALLICISICSTATAQNWPKWRGADGSGIVSRQNLLDSWPDEGLKPAWSVSAGDGYASPIIEDGIIYLFAQDGRTDVLSAIDTKTQSVIWTGKYPTDWKGGRYPGSRATPTISGNNIYTFNGGGELCCWNKNGGAINWRVNILKELSVKPIEWGSSSTVLVDGEVLYVQGGKSGPVAIAVNASNGSIIWKSQYEGVSGYSPIVKATTATGEDMLLVFSGVDIVAMDPANGKTFWTHGHETNYKINAITPIVRGDMAFFANGYRNGKATMLRLKNKRAELVWTNDNLCCRFATPILEGDYLYANAKGKLKCAKWETGEIVWEKPEVKLATGGTIVKAGNKTIALSENGDLSLLKMNTDGAEVISSFRALSEKQIWATPLLSGGKLYIRGNNTLNCYDISKKQP